MRFIAALAAALLLAACSGGDDLARATSQARAKLPYYWEHFAAPEVDEYDFSLKVKDASSPDPVWVEHIAKGDEKITGDLMVDSKDGPRRGTVLSFTEKDIVDWAFLRGEELIGHYTTRVLLPTMPPEQADGLKSMFGENPK